MLNDYPQSYHQSPEGTKEYRQAVESCKDGTPAYNRHGLRITILHFTFLTGKDAVIQNKAVTL